MLDWRPGFGSREKIWGISRIYGIKAKNVAQVKTYATRTMANLGTRREEIPEGWDPGGKIPGLSPYIEVRGRGLERSGRRARMSEAEARYVRRSRSAKRTHDFFTASFSALPAENFGTFFAGILISLPV